MSTREYAAGVKKLLFRYGGCVCSCALKTLAELEGLAELAPLCERVAAAAGRQHLSLAVHDGDVMFVPDDDAVGRVLKKDDYDRLQMRVLREYVRPGMVALDVGANCGPYALPLSRLVGPTGQVIAMEPGRANFSLLCRNMELNQRTNVAAASVAAGSRRKEGTLFLSENNHGDHQTSDPGGRAGVACPFWTCDELAEKLLGDAKADVVKLDVQGAEVDCLRGMTRILARAKYLLVEVWPAGLRAAGSHEDELLDLIGGLDVDVYSLDTHNEALTAVPASKIKEVMRECDVPRDEMLMDLWCVRRTGAGLVVDLTRPAG